LKENLLEMTVDGSLKIKFENMSICDFWFAARKEFKKLSGAVIFTPTVIPINVFV
jgi:hypothetical protein